MHVASIFTQTGLPEHLIIRVLEYLWTWNDDEDYLNGDVSSVKALSTTTEGAQELLFLDDIDPYNNTLLRIPGCWN
jgi:hypothetical protein